MDKLHGLSGQNARVDEVRVKVEDSPLRHEDQMKENGQVRKRRITGQENSGVSFEQREPATASHQFTWEMKRDLQTNVDWGDGKEFITLVQKGLTYGQLIFLCRPLNDRDIPLLLKATGAGNLSVVKLLVESFGSMRNTVVANSDFDLSKALIHAVRCKKQRKSKGVIRYLLEEGARLDIRDEDDSNLLHIACAYENGGAANILLHESSKPPHHLCFLTDKDKKNRTPLNLAIERNHVDMAKLIIQAATTLQELNVYTGHEESDNNKNPSADEPAHNLADDALHPEPSLHLACQYGRVEIIDMILQAEKRLTNVNKSELLNLLDRKNRTPLQLAIENNHAEVAVRCTEEGTCRV
ncbi:death-associated protein kinase 1-like [Lineus longissimus]|uniref:death-associated protein kinase 1-like n=1 Tax=Lineus longissimus TaxID=88925 RepID=UPI00315C6446